MDGKIVSTLERCWGDLLAVGQEMVFSKGQVLFYEGHYPYGLFVLLSGEISFTKNGIQCRDHHLWQSPKGNVIGVESFTDDTPSCCTSTATDDCRVMFLPKSRIFPLLGVEKNETENSHHEKG